MKILIFNRNGCKVTPLKRDDLDIKYISFESTILDDLMLVAKYKIFDFPTSLIIDNHGRILLKIKGTLSEDYINNFLYERGENN